MQIKAVEAAGFFPAAFLRTGVLQILLCTAEICGYNSMQPGYAADGSFTAGGKTRRYKIKIVENRRNGFCICVFYHHEPWCGWTERRHGEST